MGLFEDAWNALNRTERVMLLDERDSRTVTPAVAQILIRVALAVESQPGLFPAPTHWPIGFRLFLDDKAALVELDADPECE